MLNIFKKKHTYKVIFNLGYSHICCNGKKDHKYDDADNHEKIFNAVDEADAMEQFWRGMIQCNRYYCLIVEVRQLDKEEIDIYNVKKLRYATGAGMHICKKAMEECGYDIETAKKWLVERGYEIAKK